MDQLTVIREACAQLRRLPEPSWGQPPREPLGARAPHVAPPSGGATVEALTREWAGLLMECDAQLRGVAPFDIDVTRLALADVIEALAKSLSASGTPQAVAAMQQVVDGITAARL